MPDELLVEVADTVRRHPWWTARVRLVAALLDAGDIRPPSQILDAGCGWGVTLEALERRGYRVAGLDASISILGPLDRPGRRLIRADLAADLSDRAESFDAALALDVIEHLDEDRTAVANLGRLVRPGGLVVVSVPALPELFGEYDEVQGHRRRYDPDRLRGAFEDSGLTIERISWWGSWMLPILRRQRRRSRRRPGMTDAEVYASYLRLPPPPLTALLRLAYACEYRPALAGRLRRGTSLFAVARRPPIEA